MKAIVVDDEPLARERLVELLRAEPDVEVVAECGEGLAAIEAVATHAPDVVFLDVQMPELDGFGVVRELQAAEGGSPLVVFVTAYDKFALKAFEVHAVDYLLKPFDKARFQAALNTVRERLRQREKGDLGRDLGKLIEEVRAHRGESRAPDRLVVKTGGKVLLLKWAEIDWIEAADNYVQVHAGRESHLHRDTLSAMETRLPQDRFVRISRSAIVNVDRIKELQPMFHGDYSVILVNGTRLTLSRGYRERLDQLLG